MITVTNITNRHYLPFEFKILYGLPYMFFSPMFAFQAGILLNTPIHFLQSLQITFLVINHPTILK